MRRTQQKNITTQNIMDAIRWGSDLFDSIAADKDDTTAINNVNSRCVNLSRRQYYYRLSKLIKVGLVKRVNGRYLPTFFGIVIYNDIPLEFRRAVDFHLKINESESSNDIAFQAKFISTN